MGKILTCTSFAADILGNPQEPTVISSGDSQILFGEAFEVEEERGGYLRGKNLTDGYEGSIERVNLSLHIPKSNVVVINPSTHLYPAPDFKSRPEQVLPYMARLNCTANLDGNFLETHDGLWVHRHHITTEMDLSSKKDLADIASQFLGAPYLFGGRTIMGLDCSALVQLSMIAKGYDCPTRDSKDQIGKIGEAVKESDGLKRNDIVYFKGHVGIMIDDKKIINATARHMRTLVENLDALKKSYGDILHIARL